MNYNKTMNYFTRQQETMNHLQRALCHRSWFFTQKSWPPKFQHQNLIKANERVSLLSSTQFIEVGCYFAPRCLIFTTRADPHSVKWFCCGLFNTMVIISLLSPGFFNYYYFGVTQRPMTQT